MRKTSRLYVSRAVEIWPDLPILIDKFLENALEVEADAISDGSDAFIPAIMEHIELAGIHSGDSACVLPPVSIPEKHKKTIEEYTKRIAIELKVLGLINIQYAIANDKVYILEANPRASRTVPLVSKVCNIQMVRIATQLMLGKKMSEPESLAQKDSALWREGSRVPVQHVPRSRSDPRPRNALHGRSPWNGRFLRTRVSQGAGSRAAASAAGRGPFSSR